jgi:hypothetical protein
MRKRFFACIREAHGTLNERDKQRFPNSEHLRKEALIAAGHCDRIMVVSELSSIAAIAESYKFLDRYCVVTIKGPVIEIFKARSMARKQLLKVEFLDVQAKIFNWIYQETGVDCERIEGMAA